MGLKTERMQLADLIAEAGPCLMRPLQVRRRWRRIATTRLHAGGAWGIHGSASQCAHSPGCCMHKHMHACTPSATPAPQFFVSWQGVVVLAYRCAGCWIGAGRPHPEARA